MVKFLNMNLLDFLENPNVLVAIILTVLGVALAVLAKRMTKTFKNIEKVSDDDALMLIFKIIGLILILVGLIIMVIDF